VLSAWFVLIGLRFIEGREVSRELGVFYVLQVPRFAIPGISYYMGIGYMFFVGRMENGQHVNDNIGAVWQLQLLRGDQWNFAINVVPLVMLILLSRSVNASTAVTQAPESPKPALDDPNSSLPR
jgi:hypothetical protein